MPSLKKQNLKEEYSFLLAEKPDIALTTYCGLSVKELTDLRKSLKEKGSTLRVVKNNIFKIALADHFGALTEECSENLRGPLGLVSTKGGELSGIAKILRDYGKGNEKIQLVCGFMDSSYHSKEEMEVISSLPSRDEILSSLAASLNAPATKLASGLSQLMSSLARGIRAVAKKNNLE